jgi:hypothetical protein
MNPMNRYLNFQTNNDILTRLGIDTISQVNINKYNECFLNYINESSQVNNFILNQIKNYINKNYSLINVIDADINYYIGRINIFIGKKFKNIICEMDIEHIISLCDYFKKKVYNSPTQITNYYIYWRNEYYKMLYENILCGKYKVFGKSEKKDLMTLLDEEWNKIDFTNLVEFSNSLNKIKFLTINELNENSEAKPEENLLKENSLKEKNINEYINLITNKFDNIENIKKIIGYIGKKLEYNPTQQNNLLDIETLNDEIDDLEKETKTNMSKYNFRFIVENLKSNGYLLFEEFNKILKNKYKKSQNIQTIKTDKRIVSYYMYIISQKDSNTTNRKVNELLIRMKNYIEDIEESYYNNIAYKKITVKQESEKYKSVDLSSFDRDNSSFTIFKYSNLNQTDITQFNFNSQIEPYFDIYKSYYNSRYPDREINFDPIQSTMIVKMVFNSKPYYVHLALIQYIVLDKLYNNNNGLGIKEISLQTNITIKNLQDTINSLLQIKLIKRSTNATSVLDMKFFINFDFVHENNKISISSLVTQKEKELIEEKKEFLNDRNTIVLSNMYDHIKKNKIFSLDSIYHELSKNKIPFKIDLEQIICGINILLEKEDIIEINQNQNPSKEYKFCE